MKPLNISPESARRAARRARQVYGAASTILMAALACWAAWRLLQPSDSPVDLVLIREPSTEAATMGRLWLEGEPFCYTLEDPVRETAGRPVAEWKIPGATAIPAGRYRLEILQPSRSDNDGKILEVPP